jgi:flagellar assembly protein FliH
MAGGILKAVKYERQNTSPVVVQHIPPEPPPVGSSPLEGTQETELSPAPTPEQLLATAQARLAEAQAEAEGMVKYAQLQVDAIHEEARKAGWQAGYIAGQQQALAEAAALLAHIKTIANSAITAKEQFYTNSLTEINGLVVSIAEKIITKQLSLNPQIVSEIVGQAIKNANINGACRIRVNPADYEILSPSWHNIPSMQPSDQRWELIADKGIKRGGCVIDVQGGILDAQIETQLQQVQEAFETLEM